MEAKPEDSEQAAEATVLVVEDDALVRLMISDHLRLSGFRVIEAGDASEALALLAKGDMPVDLVFSDIHLPGPMDGVDLAMRVRAKWPTIKLMLTAGIAQVPRGFEPILDAPLLVKPYDPDEIEGLIRALICS
jgi:two-component system, response regulator PdtaR